MAILFSWRHCHIFVWAKRERFFIFLKMCLFSYRAWIKIKNYIIFVGPIFEWNMWWYKGWRSMGRSWRLLFLWYDVAQNSWSPHYWTVGMFTPSQKKSTRTSSSNHWFSGDILVFRRYRSKKKGFPIKSELPKKSLYLLDHGDFWEPGWNQRWRNAHWRYLKKRQHSEPPKSTIAYPPIHFKGGFQRYSTFKETFLPHWPSTFSPGNSSHEGRAPRPVPQKSQPKNFRCQGA